MDPFTQWKIFPVNQSSVMFIDLAVHQALVDFRLSFFIFGQNQKSGGSHVESVRDENVGFDFF